MQGVCEVTRRVHLWNVRFSQPWVWRFRLVGCDATSSVTSLPISGDSILKRGSADWSVLSVNLHLATRNHMPENRNQQNILHTEGKKGLLSDFKEIHNFVKEIHNYVQNSVLNFVQKAWLLSFDRNILPHLIWIYIFIFERNQKLSVFLVVRKNKTCTL